jgi:glycine dehydrogenase
MSDPQDRFVHRHIGPRKAELGEMLRAVGSESFDALIDEVVPSAIRLQEPLEAPQAETEAALLSRLRRLAQTNECWRSFIGGGYYGCVTPPVILRNLLENPGWYTPYTPYQAEVAQGRLESLLNFQTVVQDLTGMQVANASLLDEGTAAAEAMTLLHRVQARSRPNANRFVVGQSCFPQTIAIIQGRAAPLNITVDIVDEASLAERDWVDVFGVLLQTPDVYGCLHDLSTLTAQAHASGTLVAVATDLLALTLVTPPGEWGADVVVGNAQRFGVPMGYGGPHAAFFATRESYVRQMPGRVIGVSVDSNGRQAYRMALQTREQHIRRERATSNICTAQALLANMASMYAVYHGPDGLKDIASRIHGLAKLLTQICEAESVKQVNPSFFDTLRFTLPAGRSVEAVQTAAHAAQINLTYHANGDIGVAIDETTTREDITLLVQILTGANADKSDALTTEPLPAVELSDALTRTTDYLTHPVFSQHHSELDMMRYLKRLERKDIGLDTSMIPLGSCTMKLNAAVEMEAVTWPEFSTLHPYVPVSQAAGYQTIIRELETALCQITGFAAVSLQPNSGAQGEYAGLLAIRAYHQANGETARDVVLIPSSAHGTNPASAVMAGMKVIVVACDDDGNVDVLDLQKHADAHSESLAALMVTYPSTHGVFEESIQDICAIVHAHGGQVYMDGANMNAQVGITSPARIGADVCHLNLHKTFAIPHGGGGPGMGPIAVAAHLSPHLPGRPHVGADEHPGLAPVSAAPWGSASILLISYAYICLLGGRGMTEATRYAILNANYLKSKLEGAFDVLYTRTNGRVAHELIFDLRPFKDKAGITEQDVAKRLMDYGFHAPTVSFPVPGTLMVEPTESEPRAELDRFCEAMLAIRSEIEDIAEGRSDRTDNVLRNAPHTADDVAVPDSEWSHPYSRERAAFPLPFVRANKYWPPVGRIDNTQGDRNLICSCPPLDAYADES